MYLCISLSCVSASSGDSDGSTNRITPTVVAVITVGVVAALLLMAAALTLFVCCCLQRRRRRYHIGTHSAAVSSSSKGSLVELPPLSTPELCRREAPEELKTFDFLEEDSELIPSDVFPVNLFREHVEKFDENRQLFFQLEFDVSDCDVIMMSLREVDDEVMMMSSKIIIID